MKQKLIVAGIVGTVLVVLFIAYTTLVVVPRERMELQAQQAREARMEEEIKEAERLHRYNECMASAYRTYSLNWDGECKLLGKGLDCSLPQFKADKLEDSKRNAESNCVVMYK